jgi:hypothetical protein
MMSVLRTEALICHRVDVGERARRVRTAAGRLSSPDVLELLLDLPVGWPVPITSLTRRERDALGSVPVGAVTVDAVQVTRHAIPPRWVAAEDVYPRSANLA